MCLILTSSNIVAQCELPVYTAWSSARFRFPIRTFGDVPDAVGSKPLEALSAWAVSLIDLFELSALSLSSVTRFSRRAILWRAF